MNDRVSVLVLVGLALAGWWPLAAASARGRVANSWRTPQPADLGRLIRTRLPKHRYVDLVSDRAVAAGVAAMVAAVFVAPPAALLVPPLLVGWGMRRTRLAVAAQEHSFLAALPESLDLLALAVASGLTPRLAIDASVRWLPDTFSAPVKEVRRRVASGEPIVDALEWARATVPPTGRPLFAAVLAGERDGAPLLPALERAAAEARRQRRVAAETRARTVPVTMLLPLVLCVLPAFALLTVVPLLLGGVAQLELPG